VRYAERWPALNLPAPLFGTLSELIPFIVSSFFAAALALFMALRCWRLAQQTRPVAAAAADDGERQ
jgi:hypothetical protein